MQVSSFLLEACLHDQFGLKQLRPKQAEVIESVLSGHNTIALLPTGYGKSLCYQLPAMLLPGVTLVVSPLIALMQDQVQGLLTKGIRGATFLNSSVDFEEISERVKEIKRGEIKLIYIAPERFASAAFQRLIKDLDVSLLVIDEAHCISQWGHDFRPQYRHFSQHREHFKDVPVLALTATATPAVQRDIVATLGLLEPRIVSSSFDRANLRFDVVRIRRAEEKDATLAGLLCADQEPAIVYTSSRKESERIAALLCSIGVKSAHYHAGMSAGERAHCHRIFEREEIRVMVSTVAFGMGVDKANIRRVIHYNCPPSLENYYQEAGRAGRDGQKAECTLLYSLKDAASHKWLIGRNYPKAEDFEGLLSVLKDLSGETTNQSGLLKKLDMPEGALNNSLHLLKEDSVIDTTPNGTFKVQENLDLAAYKPNLERLQVRKDADRQRLQEMIDYAEFNQCRRKTILRYFGQNLDTNCQACDVCQPMSLGLSLIPALPVL